MGPTKAYRILVPRPGIEPPPPALAAQSLNRRTAREVPFPSSRSQVSKDSFAGPATLLLSYLLPNVSPCRPELKVLTLQVHCQFLLERGSKCSGRLFALSVETESFDGLGNPGRAGSSYQPLLKVYTRDNSGHGKPSPSNSRSLDLSVLRKSANLNLPSYPAP